MCECSPWKIASRPAASTRGATSRIEMVVSFVIRLAPMRTAALLAARRDPPVRPSPLCPPARRYLDRLARDERALIGGQEQHRVGDLLGVEPGDAHRVHGLVA